MGQPASEVEQLHRLPGIRADHTQHDLEAKVGVLLALRPADAAEVVAVIREETLVCLGEALLR